jgi:MerR family transcriptional regulator, light-induced transcriptional regulator
LTLSGHRPIVRVLEGRIDVRLFDRHRSEPVYNTRAVVQRTGVPADTFRAWERRYSVPRPTRTAGNQRLYSERDVAVVGWLRDRTKEGLTISQAVALLRLDEDSGSNDDRFTRQTSGGDGVRLGPIRERVVEALTAFDGGAAERVIEEAMVLAGVDDVCRHVIEAGLVEIGERWQRGELGVGVEHFASCFALRKAAALFNLSQPESGRGPIVAACVEGELNEVGLLLRSLFLSRHGFRIVYLGADLPCADLVGVVREVGSPVVLLLATTEPLVERLAATVRALGEVRIGSVAPVVAYGGRVFLDHPELREGVNGLFLEDEDRDAVERLHRLVTGFGAGIRE